MIDLSAGDRLLFGTRWFRHRPPKPSTSIIARSRELFGNGHARCTAVPCDTSRVYRR